MRTGKSTIIKGRMLYERSDGWHEDETGRKFSIEPNGGLAYQKDNGAWVVIRENPLTRVDVKPRNDFEDDREF